MLFNCCINCIHIPHHVYTFHYWCTFDCFYFYIFTANVAKTYSFMTSCLSRETFATQNRIFGGRISLCSGLPYLAKLLSNNEGGPTLSVDVAGLMLYTEWKIGAWSLRNSLRGLKKMFEGNKWVGKCHQRKIFLILQLYKR